MQKRKIIFKFLKLLITIGLLYLLYRQLIAKNHVQNLMDAFKSGSKSPDWKFLIMAFILMPANWLLEAYRWQTLTAVFEKMSLRRALASVLSGVSIGILTPGRVGEYGGRLAYISPQHHTSSLGATFVGSIAQNTINLILAIPLSYYFLNSVQDVTFSKLMTFVILILLLTMAALTVYFTTGKIARVLSRLNFLKKKQQWIDKLRFAEQYGTGLLAKVLVLSSVRFGIYSVQYLCVMWFLDVRNQIELLAGAIGTIYLVQSGVPLPPLTALMARGELAILVWGLLDVDAATAMASTLSLWTINLLIPALSGLYFIWNSKILRS